MEMDIFYVLEDVETGSYYFEDRDRGSCWTRHIVYADRADCHNNALTMASNYYSQFSANDNPKILTIKTFLMAR